MSVACLLMCADTKSKHLVRGSGRLSSSCPAGMKGKVEGEIEVQKLGDVSSVLAQVDSSQTSRAPNIAGMHVMHFDRMSIHDV